MPGFGRAHPGIRLLEHNAVAERKTDYNGYSGEYLEQAKLLEWRRDAHLLGAASEATLSGGGLHAARFTVRKGSYMFFGLIGADWGVEGGEDAHKAQGHCFYWTGSGQRFPGRSDWEGMQGAMEEGDCIDLLLDLGAGSMSVFKNGEPLGVMQESGLGGAGVEYRWAVVLGKEGDSARIDAVPAAEVEALLQKKEVERPPFFGVFPVFVPSLSWLNVRLYIYINGA
eukprot:COSAG06_NODE_16204_length_1013_cov_8.024070_1_plen_225_part_10